MPKTPLLLVDLDDVLSQTNAAAAKWHNETFGTHMVLSDFHYYHWWQNPGWGDASQVIAKAQMFYKSHDFLHATPVLGAVESMKVLKHKTYRLAIVTTRSITLRKETLAWVDTWFPDVFENIYFSGDFVVSKDDSHHGNIEKRLSKGEICRQLSASLLIDDSVENVLGCTNTSTGSTPALLFGDYEWGKRSSNAETAEDMMSFSERQQHEVSSGRHPEWWKEEIIHLPEGVWRVRNWLEVLLWLQKSGKSIVNSHGA
ncbi:hypothetical protein K439DRAFT_1325918 [Ramaria rubella]|nr:hypothetical protein K439DRAFT_1325918 [Ramaria rubella]